MGAEAAPVDAAQPIRLISDFNLSNLARLLQQGEGRVGIEPRVPDFGSVIPSLMDRTGADEGLAAFVWTRPQGVLPSFGDVLAHVPVPAERILADVDAFADALIAAADRLRFVLVATWALPADHRGLGILDLKSDAGSGLALSRANARLVERLSEIPNAFVLDAGRWLQASGDPIADDRLWYLAKIPFAPAVLKEAAADIRAAVEAMAGLARKLVVVDLDNTLWGGVVGDVGWESLRLGGHDAVGEAFVEFQRELKALTNRGIILGVVSKNDEEVALNAMASHDAMVLREADFAGWRINWQDKAQNVLALTQELNLGLQSVVFLDDHPAERARVREALPEVLVPEWPEDPLRYAATLRSLRCFDAPSLSAEDAERARMYATERQRREALAVASSPEEWIRGLEIEAHVETLSPPNLKRATQLLNKTNQMNLTTRRLTEPELWEWSTSGDRRVWTVRVLDRFGDYGLTGLVSVERDGGGARLVDFILSCRVFGRRIEETMVYVASRWAWQHGVGTLSARYLPTKKNKPCLQFFEERSGFEGSDDATFVRPLNGEPDPPECVALVVGAGTGA